MNNEHNPIAIRVRTVQELWIESRETHPKARVFSISCLPEDNVLVQGFVGLESTPHGMSDDTFLVFKTRMDDKVSFYTNLIEQWINAFQNDLKEHPEFNWKDFNGLVEEYARLSKRDEKALLTFYAKLIQSFKQFEGVKGNMLILVIVLEYIDELDLLRDFINDFLTVTSQEIGILFIDTEKDNIYKPIITKLKEFGCNIELPNQNMEGAYRDIMTQGDPYDPQVQYRKLLLKMSDETNAKNKQKVKDIAKEEFLPLCQKMGDIKVYASGYLIVAGLIMTFKGENPYIQGLIDKALSILREDSVNNPLKHIELMIQCYMYKGASYNIDGDTNNATLCFMESLEVAKQSSNTALIINCYNSILLIVLKKERRDYNDILKEAFDYAYSLRDDDLKLINISFIVVSYLKKGGTMNAEQTQQIEDRMFRLYGEFWSESSKETLKRLSVENKPPQ